MHISRREFLSRSGLITAGSLLIPGFLKAFERNALGKGALGEKILVIIQLSGGNDGLNTIVPYRNDVYYKSRPTIAIDRTKVLTLNDELGFNPALSPLKSLYDEGLVSIINNVGYPNPDRSHFRSMDIWQTGSEANEYWSTGWLGRYLDAACVDNCLQPYDAIEVDDTLSLAMKGRTLKGLAVKNPQKLYKNTQDAFLASLAKNSPPAAGEHENVSYLYKTLGETISSAKYVYDKATVHKTKATYPTSELGGKLKTVAELIQSGVSTNVYYVSISGFDTHVGQNGQQSRLLGMYAEAVNIFVNDLKQNNRLDDTMIMTFSEFGRRVNQNGSNGTDHGTANNLFLINGKLKKPGLFNPAPDLLDLDNGDLKYQVDFRNIYATLLANWLKANDTEIMGRKFEHLNFV